MKLHSTDYVLFNKKTNEITTFSDGSVLIFGSYDEAYMDKIADEIVTSCTDLPKDLQDNLIKKLIAYDIIDIINQLK